MNKSEGECTVNPFDNIVDPAAEISGADSEKYADRRRNDRGDDSHLDRRFCREDRPDQHIPPEIIRTERMLPRRFLKTFRMVLRLIDRFDVLCVAVTCINLRKNCGAEVEQADDQRRQCELFRAKPPDGIQERHGLSDGFFAHDGLLRRL